MKSEGEIVQQVIDEVDTLHFYDKVEKLNNIIALLKDRVSDLNFEYSARLASDASREELFSIDDFGPGDWDDPDMTDVNSPYFFLNEPILRTISENENSIELRGFFQKEKKDVNVSFSVSRCD